MPTIERLQVDAREAGERLDRFLAVRLPSLSRTRAAELIAEGRVRVDGRPQRRSHRIAAGETVEIEVAPRPPLEATPEALPIEILFEDEDIIAVNKPAGMVVHAGAGNARGTLVNALLFRYGALSGAGGALRPGIVHRLDKDTSGVLLVARNDAAHAALAAQFSGRQVRKTYIALVQGKLERTSGSIGLPIARDPQRRTRMTTRRKQGREARTDWRVLARIDGYTLVEVELHTGRTHQIRVHFSALGHPVAGDTLYGAAREPRAGKQALEPLGRNFLHAARIIFEHPRRKEPVEIRAPLPAALRDWLLRLARAGGTGTGEKGAAEIDAVLRAYL
jgi:23S rRNA pseudouridine1911/1915/1917 synthase